MKRELTNKELQNIGQNLWLYSRMIWLLIWSLGSCFIGVWLESVPSLKWLSLIPIACFIVALGYFILGMTKAGRNYASKYKGWIEEK